MRIKVRGGDQSLAVAISQGERHRSERRTVRPPPPVDGLVPPRIELAQIRAHVNERTAQGLGDRLERAPRARNPLAGVEAQVEASHEKELVDRPAFVARVPVTVIEGGEKGIDAAREKPAGPPRWKASRNLGHRPPQRHDAGLAEPRPPHAQDLARSVQERTIDRKFPLEGLAQRGRQRQEDREPRIPIAGEVSGERGRDLVPVRSRPRPRSRTSRRPPGGRARDPLRRPRSCWRRSARGQCNDRAAAKIRLFRFLSDR